MLFLALPGPICSIASERGPSTGPMVLPKTAMSNADQIPSMHLGQHGQQQSDDAGRLGRTAAACHWRVGPSVQLVESWHVPRRRVPIGLRLGLHLGCL